MIKKTFTSIDWGEDDAKGDIKLKDYFVPIPFYEDVLSGRKRFIIGRKGTGKSAILERINQLKNEDPQILTEFITLKNFPLQDFRQMRDKSFTDKSQFVPVWEFVLLNSILELVEEDQAQTNIDLHNEIQEYKRLNFNSIYGYVELIKQTQSRQNRVIISPTYAKYGLGSGEFSSTSGLEQNVSIHYTKIVDVLKNMINSVKTTSSYYLLLDELDEGYKAGDSSIRLIILALLKAVQNLSTDLSHNVHILLGLRSDIFDRLEDSDVNKIDDYVLRLDWSGYDGNKFHLIDIVNARICSSFGINEIINIWPSVAINNDQELPKKVKTLWDYISNRTMERPRDIIKYMKFCSSTCIGDVLTYKDVKTAEIDFSKWLYNELRDEIHSYLPVWNEACQVISKIGRGKFPATQFITALKNDSAVSKYVLDNKITYVDVMKQLFDFSVIGNVHNGRWIFKYKDHDFSFDEKQDVIVHYGFHKKLRIR